MSWLAPLVRRFVAANQAPAAPAAPAESQVLAQQTAAQTAATNAQNAKRKRKQVPGSKLGSDLLDPLAPQGNVLTSSTWIPRRQKPPMAQTTGGI